MLYQWIKILENKEIKIDEEEYIKENEFEF